jgi:hypothetical protein
MIEVYEVSYKLLQKVPRHGSEKCSTPLGRAMSYFGITRPQQWQMIVSVVSTFTAYLHGAC